MSKADFYDWIPAYLDGTLEAKELSAFETALADDTDLRAAVELQGQIESSLREDAAIMDLLKTARAEINTNNEQDFIPVKSSAKVRSLYVYLSAAATIVLLIGAFFWWQGKPASAEALLASYQERFEAEDILSVDFSQNTRSEQDTAKVQNLDSTTLEEDFLSQARNTFRNKEYDLAITQYLKHIGSKPTNVEQANFELAVLYWKAGEYEKSAPLLLALPDRFSPQKEWYLSLNKIELGAFKEAQLLLKNLATLKSPYQKRSKELLLLLEDF